MAQDEARSPDPRNHPPREEAAFAKELLEDVVTRRDSKEFKEFRKQLKRNRQYVEGRQYEDDEEGLVRANLIHAEIKKAVNESYAKDPEVDISPTEAVDRGEYEQWKAFGKTLELVLMENVRSFNLKKRAKRAIRAADTTGFGWLKVIYQRDIEEDPVVVRRLRDSQDDLKRLESLLEAAEDEQRADLEARIVELREQIASLEEEAEVVRREGLVFSLRPTECIIFSDDVDAPEEICDQASWIADEIWMTVEQCRIRFGWVPEKATRYTERMPGEDASQQTATEQQDKRRDDRLLVRIYEVWRAVDSRIYTLVEGFDGFLRPPFTPKPVGDRFYGFFPLFFDPIDGSPFPLPLVTQLRELQDEHNTARTNFREHRERNIPFNIAQGRILSSRDVTRLTNPAFMETVVLESLPENTPLEQVFHEVRGPAIDPAVYTTDHIREDWERITHRGDAARGTIARAKTATEAEILQQNLIVDTTERQDVVEEWLKEVFIYSAELLLQEVTVDQARRIAGPDAVWPNLRKDEVFSLVRLEIRAGSTGKPNRQSELQKWLQMLPELRDTLMTIVEMEGSGRTREAEVLTKLLRISLERFDERLDLDALLPEPDEEEQAQQQMQQQQMLMEQQRQAAIQLRDLLSQIANRDADTMKKLAEAEAKEIGTQIDQYLKLTQALIGSAGQSTPPMQ
ncbi:MAG TPA: hypothetical protein ENK10_05455 [Acidobacteria bacterium]|nr:hypothetical protein [Acidobacteriota bacterium]